MKCPKCESPLSLAAAVPDSERLKVELTRGEGMFSADSIGAVLTNMDKVLKITAKDEGAEITVYIAGIRFTEESLTFELVLAKSERKPKKRKSA